VLELEDLEDRAFDLDVIAVLELVRGNRENQPLLQDFLAWLSNLCDQKRSRRPARGIPSRSATSQPTRNATPEATAGEGARLEPFETST
jgi:hypothetical protein